MSKNMTRKGLVLGVASSVVLAGFVGLPANAAGLADTSFVSLAPNAGKEYNVITGSQKEFALKANAASSVFASGAYLKFLITDASGTVVADQGSGKSTKYTETHTAVKSGTTVTLTIASGATKLKTGDRVFLSGANNNTGLPTATTATAVTVTGATTFTITAADNTALSTPGNITVTLAPNAYDADEDTFVYQTRLDGAGADQVLVLETANAETLKRVVTVTAWVDSNNNDVIDSTEYVSPTTTVSWLTSADVEAVTTLTYPTAGDSSVSAAVALTPNLNEDQMAAGDVQIGFTRPGSTATVYANATQDNTTRAWSASQSLVTGNWAGMPHIAQIQSISGATPSLYTVSPALDIAVADSVITAGTTAADGSVAATAVASAPSTSTFTLTGVNATAQAGAAGYARVVSRELVGVSSTATALTYTTLGAHGLSIGDLVTIDASNTTNSNQFDVTRAAVASVPSATSFTVAGTGLTVVGTPTTDDTGDVTYVSFVEAVPGTFTAKAKVATVVRGNTSTNVTVANASDDTTLATTATANVQGVSNSDATSTSPYTTAYVRKAQTSVELTATVVDEDDVAVSAGRTVKVTLENLQGNGAANKSGTFKIDGATYTSAVYLKTDANGKVTFTVSDDDGAVGTKVRVLVVPENLTGAKTADIELLWADAVYSIYDLNDNADVASTGHNSVVAGGSYAYSIAVLDQWKTAPAAGSHRVKYVTTGNTVATNYITLTNGRGTYTVTDNNVGGGTSIQTVFSLEKLGTDGATWTAQDLLNDGDSDGSADDLTYTTSVVSSTATWAVQLDTDGSTAYGAGAAADLSDTATTTQVVAQDRRTANAVQPAYSTGVRVTGRVANASTNAPRAGAEVTISGPASILFSEGAVDSLGTLTVKADASGEFGIDLYSTTAQTDTVITVTSGGATKTVKVSFTGQGASFGTSWVITAPANALPGSTFQFKAKLVDKFNNPVQVSTAGDVKVTYTGPGLIVGTLPNTTDKDGELSFAVLLGTNDKGTAAVTLSYDQNSDDDFLDAKDIVTSKTITVGTAAAASGGKVNVGSFNGKLVVYASGLNGARISWKVGGNWGSQVASSNYAIFNRPTPRAGVTVSVDIYVNGVKTLTKSVVTR